MRVEIAADNFLPADPDHSTRLQRGIVAEFHIDSHTTGLKLFSFNVRPLSPQRSRDANDQEAIKIIF